jgi:hypothetical protein
LVFRTLEVVREQLQYNPVTLDDLAELMRFVEMLGLAIGAVPSAIIRAIDAAVEQSEKQEPEKRPNPIPVKCISRQS